METVLLSLRPDWDLYNVPLSELTKEFGEGIDGFEWNGPGWYNPNKQDTVLITQCGLGRYTGHVWNTPNARDDILRAAERLLGIVNLPQNKKGD